MSDIPDDARTRLLETAGEIFAEKGFHAATVRDICSAAGANIAAVNYYFGDKMALYVEAVKHAHLCRFSGALPQWTPDTPPELKLRDFIQGMVRQLLDDARPAWNAKLMIRELADPTEACKAITEQYIRPNAAILQSIVVELLPPGSAPRQVQMTAFSVVGQCLFYRVQEPVAKALLGEEQYKEFTVERIAEHITRFTLAALGKQLPVTPPARSATCRASTFGSWIPTCSSSTT
jgi:TetR/AcrR family transcriptional regulator, regulator of cefoperazone and chloramphenicol sensitivity